MENNRADIFLIQQYLEGKLDPKQMHQLERQALDDPFLADALDGYAHSVKPINSQLSILQRQLEERIAAQQEEKSVFNFTWQRLSIAAAAGLMFISAGILFWMNSHKEVERTAKNNVPKTEIIPASPKSKQSSESSLNTLASQDKTAVVDEDSLLITAKSNRITAASRAAKISRSRKAPVLRAAQENALEIPSDKPEVSSSSPGLSEVAIIAKMPATTDRVASMSSSTVEIATLNLRSSAASGKVVDQNGLPLPGAAVTLRERNIAIQTNAKGEFTLPDSTAGTLSASYLGYTNKEVKVRPGEKILIALEADKSQLSEVVVQGYGSKKGTQSTYREYLNQNIRYSAKMKNPGDVTVEFRVDKRGRTSDFKILKSLDQISDAEAIRLVKDGPKWKGATTNQGYRTQVDITFNPPQ